MAKLNMPKNLQLQDLSQNRRESPTGIKYFRTEIAGHSGGKGSKILKSVTSFIKDPL